LFKRIIRRSNYLKGTIQFFKIGLSTLLNDLLMSHQHRQTPNRAWEGIIRKTKKIGFAVFRLWG